MKIIPRKVVIIGASSGMGYELASRYAARGCRVAVLARRVMLLKQLAEKFPQQIFPYHCDVAEPESEATLHDAIASLGGMDLFLYSAGVGELNSQYDYANDAVTIAVNVIGFTRLTNAAFRYFRGRKYEYGESGQIAAITSIAGLRGQRGSSVYSASKAFEIRFLEGLRQQTRHDRLPITITTLIPGFVQTAMAKGDGLFWVAPVGVASQQIITAIEKRRRFAYITRRWRLIAILLTCLPNAIYERL